MVIRFLLGEFIVLLEILASAVSYLILDLSKVILLLRLLGSVLPSLVFGILPLSLHLLQNGLDRLLLIFKLSFFSTRIEIVYQD